MSSWLSQTSFVVQRVFWSCVDDLPVKRPRGEQILGLERCALSLNLVNSVHAHDTLEHQRSSAQVPDPRESYPE